MDTLALIGVLLVLYGLLLHWAGKAASHLEIGQNSGLCAIAR